VWIGGEEAVEVEFLPEVLPFPELLEHADAGECAQHVYATTDAQLAAARARVGERARRLEAAPRAAKGSDQLYYLRRSPLRFVPLSPSQARRVNGALGLPEGGHPLELLSPRQRALAEAVAKALAEDDEALDGLERPAALDELDEYEAELRAELKAAGAL
jgi:hypothetical protein